MAQTMRQQAYDWVAAAINLLPDVSATPADKDKACRAMAAAAGHPPPAATDMEAARYECCSAMPSPCLAVAG
jgi:hypothetical protein